MTGCAATHRGDTAADPATFPDPPAEAAVQQQVKNLCVADLKQQAAGTTSAPDRRGAGPVNLVRLRLLGNVRQVKLPADGVGYELRLEIRYARGRGGDTETARKLCTANLADSSLSWKFLP